jgi:hypothetical protein
VNPNYSLCIFWTADVAGPVKGGAAICAFAICALMSTRTSTTLADLLRPPFVANPFSAVRASLRRKSSDEFENSLAHGGQGWVGRRPVDCFFPPSCFEPAILEEGVGDHRHERMTTQALPGSYLEVVKTKFFFHLLVSLLANPARLEGGC